MTSRERIKALFAHKEPDRIGKYDHFWWEALAAFQEQGMPEGTPPEDYFDYDIRQIARFDQSFQLPEEVVEETDEYIIRRTSYGSLEKSWKHTQSTPELIAFACATREKWETEFKQLTRPNPTRFDLEPIKKQVSEQQSAGRYVCFSCLEVFESTWRKCGPEVQLESLALDPEWILDMYQVDTELTCWAFEEMWSAGIHFDGFWVYGDIAYKNGPLISPRMYRELVMPFHKRICDMAHSKGCEVIFHGCGNSNLLMPLFIEAGVDCFQTMEVKSGMDVVELKKLYGDKLSFMGNIDARLLQTNDRAGLEREFAEKVTFAKKGGGYVYHSDHSVPPGTTLDTYRFVMDLVEKYGRY